MSFSGCDRESSFLRNLSFSALGFGSPEFDFVTIENSNDIVSVEFVDEEQGDAAERALIFQESVVSNSTIRYFGDVSGSIGEAYGRTQNGTYVVHSKFLVQDPSDLLPSFVYRTSKY